MINILHENYFTENILCVDDRHSDYITRLLLSLCKIV